MKYLEQHGPKKGRKKNGKEYAPGKTHTTTPDNSSIKNSLTFGVVQSTFQLKLAVWPNVLKRTRLLESYFDIRLTSG